MINSDSLDALRAAQWTEHFKRPLYKSYAFSEISHSVLHLLTGQSTLTLPIEAIGEYQRPEVLVLFLIDGFGWCFFEKYFQEYPFLSRFEKEGRVSKISAQFPSTTAAHITSLCTGLSVGETGIYEWFQYEPCVDRIITPLTFSFGGDHEPGTLKKAGLAPEELFPFITVYDQLKNHKIDSYVIQHENICHSPYSHTLFRSAHLIGYRSFSEGLEKAVEICKAPHAHPIYLFIYFGDIDAAGHRHGSCSKPFNDAVHHCWQSIEQSFYKPLAACQKRIALIATADHGMVDIDPRTTFLLNKELPQLSSVFKVNRQGNPIVPAGSCRDFFLHIKDEHLHETKELLLRQLKGKCEVFLVSDLIKEGFFDLPSSRFLERVGNLVILPYAGESVWWYEKNRYKQNFYGAHGGLTPEEMESMFLYLTLN